MRSLAGWRTFGMAVMITVVMSAVGQAQQPTTVFSIRGIDALLDDAEFIAGELDQEGIKESANQYLEGVTGGKGLAGIDRSKPLGVYWNGSAANGAPEMPVLFVPVSDAKALKELLGDLVPDLKDEDGFWSATVEGNRLFGKLSGKYLFISPDQGALSKVADPAKIVNAKYDVALEVSIASIPDPLKGIVLSTAETGRQSLNDSQPEDEAEKAARDALLNGALAAIKSLITDGDRVTFGIDIDAKARLATVDFGLTGKASSPLAKALTEYGKTTPLFAAIGSDTAPFRMVFSYPTTLIEDQLDTIFDSAQAKIDQQIDNDERLADDDAKKSAKNIVARVLDVFQSTAKSGSMHSGLVLESGGSGKARIIGGTKVAKGDEAAKLLDDLIKASKDNPDYAKIKVDAARHTGARIHSVTMDQDDDNQKYFGKEPGHLAFRPDSIWVSIGGDNLNALKKALDAKPSPRVATSPISLQVKPAALVQLLEKDNEGLLERSKEVVGKPGDKLNLDVAPVTNGAKLRLEFGIDVLQLFETEDK